VSATLGKRYYVVKLGWICFCKPPAANVAAFLMLAKRRLVLCGKTAFAIAILTSATKPTFSATRCFAFSRPAKLRFTRPNKRFPPGRSSIILEIYWQLFAVPIAVAPFS
jgi:hypothetical protein